MQGKKCHTKKDTVITSVIARFFRRKNRGNPVKTYAFNTTPKGVVTALQKIFQAA
ncbi:MAG: hypothetical protein IKZ88_09400 [Neisseriaceae bacterium]|nr:hypothetical protein [Neisseriaceae bacterium]